MKTENQINEYIESQSGQKRLDMIALHDVILKIMPDCKLWFLDGKNGEGKVVSNPNIGYGSQTMKYANGKTREFYQIGLSANTTGISVYIMGIADKNYLSQTFEKTIGMASITGYCIKFKKLEEINLSVLQTAIRHGFEQVH